MSGLVSFPDPWYGTGGLAEGVGTRLCPYFFFRRCDCMNYQ